MRLERYYYDLLDEYYDADGGVFRIALRPECDIYAGHFPGNPVCPGVCNIQVIKECAERLVGKRLHPCYIRQCRLTAVARPTACREFVVKINLTSTETGYAVVATMADVEQTYMEYKGEMGL